MGETLKPENSPETKVLAVRDMTQYPEHFRSDFDFNQEQSEFYVEKIYRPTMTFSQSNGRLAFVDEDGFLHLSILSNRNRGALERAGYRQMGWKVPGTGDESPAFNEWYERNRYTELYDDGYDRSQTLSVPDIPHFGRFGGSRQIPGEFTIAPDGQTISWFCTHLPEGNGWTSGVLLSPNTPENVAKLEAAGYKLGSWPAIDVTKQANKTHELYVEWLNNITAA